VALAGYLAYAFWPHSHQFPPPPKPGYESPANVVAGYTTGLFTKHPAAACRYTVPSERSVCGLGMTLGARFAELTGTWTIGHMAISGGRAIVDVEYRARGTLDGISYVNTDPDAGLPNSALSFEAAYQQVFSSHYFVFATDCVFIGGRWYVQVAQSGS